MRKSLVTRRILVFILILVMVVMTLCACSQKENDKSEEKKEESTLKNSGVPEVVHEEDDTEGLTGALAFVRKLRLG